MVFLRDCCVAAVLMFRTNGMPRLHGCKRAAAQARLALSQKTSTGGWVNE